VGTGGSVTGGAADAGPTYIVPGCTPVMVPAGSPAINDFEVANPDMDGVSWGDFMFMPSGYSFYYPKKMADADGGLVGPLTSLVAGGVWRISGMVNSYAGFALEFACKTDASLYTGVSFTVSGNAGTPSSLVFHIAAAPDEPVSVSPPGSWGTCVPRLNDFDGTCVHPSKPIPVTATATAHTVKWEDAVAGRPLGSPDPRQLIRFSWVFNWNGSGPPYPVDVTLDNVVFTTN
jgi:hypothetical protein